MPFSYHFHVPVDVVLCLLNSSNDDDSGDDNGGDADDGDDNDGYADNGCDDGDNDDDGGETHSFNGGRCSNHGTWYLYYSEIQ